MHGSKLMVGGVFLLEALALFLASPCRADSGPEERRTWAVGWDQGLAARYRAPSGWGIGLRVDPGVIDDSGEDVDDLSTPREERVTLVQKGSEYHGLNVGLLAFREVEFGRWFRAGPYGELSFRYARWERIQEATTGDGVLFISDDDQYRTWTLEIGMRPAFAIEDRFVLEARLGIALVRTADDHSHESGQDGTVEDGHRNNTDTWRFRFLGQDLGFGSTLQFFIYL